MPTPVRVKYANDARDDYDPELWLSVDPYLAMIELTFFDLTLPDKETKFIILDLPACLINTVERGVVVSLKNAQEDKCSITTSEDNIVLSFIKKGWPFLSEWYVDRKALLKACKNL